SPESGSLVAVSSVAAPVMKPLFDTRAAGDVLLEVAQKLKKPLDLPWKTYDELLKATFDQLGEDAWSAAQKQRGWWGQLPARLAGDRSRRGGDAGRTGTSELHPLRERAWREPDRDSRAVRGGDDRRPGVGRDPREDHPGR